MPPKKFNESDLYKNYPCADNYTEVFDTFFNDCDMQYFFQEIRRRYIALLENDGELVKLLVRKTTGDICPHVPLSNKSCPRPLADPACYGTGIIGGYETPINIKVRLALTNFDSAPQEVGRRPENVPRSWTLWTPEIHEYDVLATSTGLWYEVQDVTKYYFRGSVTRQDFTVRQLIASDSVTKFPL